MQQDGTVRKTEGEIAFVVVKRQSACGENCGNCSGCKDKFSEITAENKIGAISGDNVVVEMNDALVLYAAFLVYIVPLIIFFVSFGIFSLFGASQISSVVISALISALFYVFLGIYDKKQKNKYIHKIVRIK